MDPIRQILDRSILGNTLQTYFFVTVSLFLALIVLRLIKSKILGILKIIFLRLSQRSGQLIHHIFETTVYPLFYLLAFYFALQALNLSVSVHRLISAGVVILLTIQATRFVIAVLTHLISDYWLTRKTSEGAQAYVISKSILTLIQILIWVLAMVFILDNLGWNISALVAGLGIGGIAVALAAQNILGDLFNYFVIFFDKPFEEEDFIILDDYMGSIENIGLKTTRIRSLSGEQIVIPNTVLTSAKIRNYKRMQMRRVQFQLDIVYQTPLERVKQIPEIIKQIITTVKATKFDRAHFKEFAESSLKYEVVYYVLSADYNLYMDTQQEINFKIKEKFEKVGIEFAFPTQVQYEYQIPTTNESGGASS